MNKGLGLILLIGIGNLFPVSVIKCEAGTQFTRLAVRQVSGTDSEAIDKDNPEIDGARQALDTLRQAQTPSELAKGLTNETAARFGFRNITTGLIADIWIGSTDPAELRFLNKDPNLVSDFKKLMDEIGMTELSSINLSAITNAIEPHGRDYFCAVCGINDRLNRLIAASGSPSEFGPFVSFPNGNKLYARTAFSLVSRNIPEEYDDYVATVETADTVLLTPKVPTRVTSSRKYQAVLDGGVWRISMTDVLGSSGAGQEPTSNSLSEQPAQSAIAPSRGSSSTHATSPTNVLFDAINNLQLPEVKRILTSNPNWVDARNHLNESPLIKAVSDRSVPIVSYLLTLYPDLTAVDDNGDTAMDKAKSVGNQSIIKLLAKYNAP